MNRLTKAAPPVSRSTLWIGEVERGPLTISVRGPGVLVPETVRWVTATSAGEVERVLIEIGDVLQPGSAIVELSNDDLKLRQLEAQRELAGARAELVNLRAQLQKDRLAQEATVASTRAELKGAQRTLEADHKLSGDGLISAIELAKDQDRVDELEILLDIEKKRLALFDQVEDARLSRRRTRRSSGSKPWLNFARSRCAT